MRVFIPVESQDGVPYILATGMLINPAKIRSLPQNEKIIIRTVNFILILSFLILLLLVTFLGIWVGNKLGKSLSEPLQNLILATQKISQRDFNLSELLELPSKDDEIAQLIQSFKYMAKELKSYENTLKKYNEYLVGVLNSLPVGIVIYKSNLDIFFINEYLKNFLKTLGTLHPEKTLVERLNLENLFQSLSLKEKYYQVHILKNEGEDYSLGITYMKLELFGELLLLLIIENLEEKEKLKRLSLWREVAIKIAHEIKNPLTPIKLSIERLKRRIIKELSPENRELLEKTVELIGKSIEDLRKLALDFYYFSHRPYFEKVEFSLVDNIREVLDLYLLAYPEVNFNLQVLAQDINIKGDPFQLKRVWINLIENSLKAMEGKGEICMDIFNEGDAKIIINYEDTGVGMSQDILSAFNMDDFSKLQRLGTGLLLIKGTIELHKGRVWVEPSLKGGAKFVIELTKE